MLLKSNVLLNTPPLYYYSVFENVSLREGECCELSLGLVPCRYCINRATTHLRTSSFQNSLEVTCPSGCKHSLLPSTCFMSWSAWRWEGISQYRRSMGLAGVACSRYTSDMGSYISNLGWTIHL